MLKRRDFSLGGAALLAGAVLPDAHAQRMFQPGQDYLPLRQPAPVEASSSQIEVVEFFWYNCPHCNSFEPMLNDWIKRLPKDVAFRRVPVAFRSNFVGQQKLYYALEELNLVDKLHGKVFHAVHMERKRLEDPAIIADWIAQQGVDRAKFMEQFNSFSVATKARRASQVVDAYAVEGVPALGVAGRFYTDGSLTKNMTRALQVTDYLIDEVRKGR